MTTAGVRPQRTPSLTSRGAAGRPAARTAIATAVLTLLLGASVLVAVGFGPASISPSEVGATIWAHLTGGERVLSATQDAIVWQLRVPRVLTAAIVGGGLALCGAVMQALTRNPLADPYLLGLSAGASTGAVIVLVLGVSIALPAAAFAGAMLALILTFAIGRGGGGSPTSLILTGLAVSAVLSALTSLVIFWSATNDSYREILSWLLGSIAGAQWSDVLLVAVVMAVCAVPLLGSARTLDGFALGDSAAGALGIPVERMRIALFACCALLTGALVAVSGAIGFVGLILPHATRAIVGVRHRALLPTTVLVGALFLLWADTVARTAFDPRELPVGIVTALIGGPVFAVLLTRVRRGRR